MFYYDKFKESNYIKVHITCHDNETNRQYGSSNGTNTFTFFLMNESTSHGGTASYNQAIPRDLVDMALGNFGQVGTQIADLIGMAKTATGTGQLAVQSIKKWEETSSEPLQIEVLSLAMRESDRSERDFAILASKVYPTLLDTDGWVSTKDFFFKAPMGYNPFDSIMSSGKEYFFGDNVKLLQGTCTVQIGLWYTLTNVLLTDVNFTASKECIKNGSPLYCQGQITFSSYRDISQKDFLQRYKFAQNP